MKLESAIRVGTIVRICRGRRNSWNLFKNHDNNRKIFTEDSHVTSDASDYYVVDEIMTNSYKVRASLYSNRDHGCYCYYDEVVPVSNIELLSLIELN